MKTCTKCFLDKEIKDYYLQSPGKTKSQCKECDKKRSIIQKKIKETENKIVRDKWRSENKERLYKDSAEWNKNNRFIANKSQKKYREANRVKINESNKKQRKELESRDPLAVMKRRLRNRTGSAFRRTYWNKKGTVELLGAEYQIVFKRIESLFTEGMNWDNRNLWHIDHIIPLDSAKTEKELAKLCHYTNLQPLWAKDNLIKSNKIKN
jgi:hypothetical protein